MDQSLTAPNNPDLLDTKILNTLWEIYNNVYWKIFRLHALQERSKIDRILTILKHSGFTKGEFPKDFKKQIIHRHDLHFFLIDSHLACGL